LQQVEIVRDGTGLVAYDHGGPPGAPGALLLHGLAGHAGEWDATVSRLSGSHRVVTLDQRGHGRSERLPQDVTRAAFAADAVAVIERMQLGPALVIGQSMGGNTAFLTAAARPDLLAALVVAEASPDGPVPGLAAHIEQALGRWPRQFADREEALAFFAARGLPAEVWADGLEPSAAGLVPRWEQATMVACARELGARSWWEEWRRVRCPTLVLAGQASIGLEHATAMADALEDARAEEIAGAGHELHLEAEREWCAAITGFLAGLGG
jgi:pimeloyl-ACP methyl ester carboxylesterase